jgi:hypothetical protein
MKPVVSAAQIAAQAYAQRTSVPPRATPQPGFSVDSKNAATKVQPDKAIGVARRVSQETDAFKIEISAEALEASRRDAGQRSARVVQESEQPVEDVAKIAFQSIDGVNAVTRGGRREAPFAHTPGSSRVEEPPRRPGFLLDITI